MKDEKSELDSYQNIILLKNLSENNLLDIRNVTKEEKKPIMMMKNGTNRPVLCFFKCPNAIIAATKWTRKDEKMAHKKTVYHITALEKINHINSKVCFIGHTQGFKRLQSLTLFTENFTIKPI